MGLRRARTLSEAGADVAVVAPKPSPELADLGLELLE
ncbi:MAG: hypothetical protein QOK10_2976, partial [Pseudonocardiales bacterium]|nr:hypothetical protein [Pseudonocardiales bacterium]